METTPTIRPSTGQIIVGALLLALGLLLSLPWLLVLVAGLLLGKEPSLLVYLLVGIWVPLVLGRLLLQWAQERLSAWSRALSYTYLGLGALWALTLAIILVTMNLLAVAEPTARNLLLGIVLAVVGTFFITQAASLWPAGKERIERLGGWIYLGVAVLYLVLGAIALLQGGTSLAALWFFLAALTAWLAAGRLFPTAASWSLLGLGTLLAIPWVPVALVSIILGAHAYTPDELAALGLASAPPLSDLGLPLPLPVFLLVGLAVPLLAGVLMLSLAHRRLTAQAIPRAYVSLGLAGLWGLTGPLAMLNLLYGHLFVTPTTPDPIVLLLVGAVAPLAGLLFLRQAEEVWPAGRGLLRRLFGWLYLGVAVLEAIAALVALLQGQALLLAVWLACGALTAWLAANRAFPALSCWVILALGVLLAIPWLPPLLLKVASGQAPSSLLFLLTWLGLPLLATLTALRWARAWLEQHPLRLAVLHLVLGALWTLTAPLAVLNVLYGWFLGEGASTSLPILIASGAAAVLVGLFLLAQARAIWPGEGKAIRRLNALALLGGTLFLAALGLLGLGLGQPALLVPGLVLAALAAWLAIAQVSAQVAGWILLGLGALLAAPWAAPALAVLILGHPLSLVELLLAGLGVALVIGLPLLLWSRRWLPQNASARAIVFRVLGLLWAAAGPLSVANLLYGKYLLGSSSHDPLGLLLVGVVPPIVGLLHLGQVSAAQPTGRAATRRLGGWVYLGVAVVQVALGFLALAGGDPLLLISWLTQATFTILMAALLFEIRAQVTAALLIGLGLLIPLLFIPGTPPGAVSTFVLNPTGGMVHWPVPDASFPTEAVIALMMTFALGLGAWQSLRQIRVARAVAGGVLAVAAIATTAMLTLAAGLWESAAVAGEPISLAQVIETGSPVTLGQVISAGLSTGVFVLIILALTLGLTAWQMLRGRETSGIIGAILFLFIVAFLLWASRGREFNMTGMLIGTLEAATPIALGALSGVWCERSAVINIAIEGMMLSGAFAGVVVGSATGSQFIGLLGGMLVGLLLGALLAVLSIRFKVNQIIAGTAINIFATGLTSYLSARWLAQNQSLNSIQNFPRAVVPVLSRIPVIGPVLFQNNLPIYLMLALVAVTHIVLFSTRWGLRSRAVGEHPLAADTLGVKVLWTRYVNVLIGGVIAGLGGAYFTLGSVGRFDEEMTAGRGFIGLAAMIFGRWTPVGSLGSSLIFGFAQSLQMKLGLLDVPIPSNILLMAPYLATIIILAGVVGRAVAPAADGVPYEKQ